jgi:hypothetical protein
MVDVIKTLGFEYVAANPGSSFKGLHESIINYGANKMPELLHSVPESCRRDRGVSCSFCSWRR